MTDLMIAEHRFGCLLTQFVELLAFWRLQPVRHFLHRRGVRERRFSGCGKALPAGMMRLSAQNAIIGSMLSRFTSTWTKRQSRGDFHCLGGHGKSLLVGHFTMRSGRGYSPRTLVSKFIWLSTMPRRWGHVTQGHV
jgi:hypothetical protein